MRTLLGLATAACLAGLLCLTHATPVQAQASGDGRQGPVSFNGNALDQSLVALNGFLQARYTADDIYASLHTPPQAQDFVTVARNVSDAPRMTNLRVSSDFGPEITGGRSLDLHLASFHEDVQRKGEPLFIRIARQAGGTGLNFAEAGAVPPAPHDETAFGPAIFDDVTLNGHMIALIDHMFEQSTRNEALAPAAPLASTGSSFDRYGSALNLF